MTVSPNACRYCDVDRETHLQRWAPEVQWHRWIEPTPEQRRARMLARRTSPTTDQAVTTRKEPEMTENTNTEPLDGEPEPDPAEMMEALTSGRDRALYAASYWRGMAVTLTDLRAGGGLIPDIPIDAEQWYLEDPPALPFDLEEMDAELKALSGLITKAHTLAVVYAERAVELDKDVEVRYAD